MKTTMRFIILLTLVFTLVNNDLFSEECPDVLLPANTIIISEDTFLQCTGANNHYLICSGATVTYTDNSCFCTFYLEPGSSLIIDESSYGYSNVYVPLGASFDANFCHYGYLYYELDANLQDTTVAFGPPVTYTECDNIIYDYSLSGSCNEPDPGCDDILLPAETVIVSSDTSIVCAEFNTHFLICSGVTAQFADNSCFDTFYLEPGASLTLTGYGYSTVYAREDSYFDANFINFQFLYFETNANIYDTASPNSPFNFHECDDMNFDYSLSGSCSPSNIENSVLANLEFYPNPANDFININLEEDNLDLKIYNYTGSLVIDRKISKGENVINISDLSQGIYLIFFSFNDKTRVEKLVIE
jgi:hypothetical protein